jgi:hypothetical protein
MHAFTSRLAARLAVAAALTLSPALARASVYGTLGNFDVVNDTGKTAHGFEIDLEGLHTTDVTDTFGGAGRGFPTSVERYGAPTIQNYVNGTSFGVSVIYSGIFGANGWNVGTPSGVFSTPGESCWTGGGIGYGAATPCDHFGVGTRSNATKTTYNWLTETAPNSSVLAPVAASLPAPTWTVTPAPAPVVVPGVPQAPPAPPIVVAHIQAPPPPVDPADPQFGTAEWVKVFTTELDAPVALEDLVGGNAKVQQAKAHTEVEWQLLQTDPGNPAAGAIDNGGAGPVGANAQSVIRRYEFYKYTGAVDPQNGEAFAVNGDSATPAAGDLGNFIGAQNDAINLNGVYVAPVAQDVPEPASLVVLGLGLLGIAQIRRRHAR